MTLDARRKSNWFVIIGVVLLTSYWAIDLVLDSFGSRYSQYRILFDATFFLFQICVVGIVWYSLKRRGHLEDSLVAARQQALDDKARTETILSSLYDSISIIDHDFKVLYQNKAHQAMSQGDHRGQYCYRAFSHNESICDGCPVERTFRDGFSHRQEKSMEREGQLLHIEIITSPIFNDRGEVAATIETVRDVTQRWLADEKIFRLNEQLRKNTIDLTSANQDLEAFNYSLSHDLRSPLAQIITSTEILALNLDDAVKQNDHNAFLLETITQSAERIDQMIQGMLDLSRLGGSAVVRKNVDLGQMAAEVFEQLKHGKTERSVALSLGADLVADADQILLRVAIQNLIENAWKYTAGRDDARIEFGSYLNGEERVFYVRDNGVGFNQAQHNRLFHPFQRLHSAKEFPGSGIGLSTVQRIIQRHGGKIWAEGSEGVGATFYFTLEASQPTA